MALIPQPISSIFQFPPNFPNGQVSDAWVAYFNAIQYGAYPLPAPSTGFAIGWDGAGNLINVPNTGANQTAAWTAADAVVTAAYQAADTAAKAAVVATSVQIANLAGTGGGQGAQMVGYVAPYTGAVATTQHIVNAATPIYAYPTFLSDAQLADAQTNSPSLDTTTALQAAINAAISSGKKLIIPWGTYKISSPLMVTNLNGSTWGWVGVDISGEKTAWDFPANTTNGTVATRIKPTYNNAPAMVIAQAVGVRLSSIAFIGTNDVFSVFNANPANYYKVMTASNLNTNASRDSRYSPYCAVAIDPFNSTGAAAGYPTLSAYYVGSPVGSTDTQFEDCRFENFVVGVALSMNSSTQNNDKVTFRNCMFGYIKVGLAIGQDQSRGINLFNCQYYFCYTAIDSVSYGQQIGTTVKAFGGIAVCVKYLFNTTSSRQDTVLVDGLYCESLASLGFFGSGAQTQNTIVFQGCAFNFADFGAGTGVYPDTHFYNFVPALFDGCSFTTINQTKQGPIRITSFANAPITFRSCSFAENSVGEFPVGPSQLYNGMDWSSVFFDGCVMSEYSSRGAGLTSELSHRVLVFSGAYNDCLPSPMGQLTTYTGGTTGQLLLNGSLYSDNQVSLGSKAISAPGNGVGTFTATDGTIIKVGDLIYADTSITTDGPAGAGTFSPTHLCIGIVKTVVANAVTIYGLPQSIEAYIVANGAQTLALYSEWVSRAHQASTCTTNSTTTLASVTPTGTWKNGHHIKGSGIPAGAYIVSGGGTATLIISKAATSGASGVRIYDADLKVLTGVSL